MLALFDGIREGNLTKVKRYLPGPREDILAFEDRFKQYGASPVDSGHV
jgi:hypothetical protein